LLVEVVVDTSPMLVVAVGQVAYFNLQLRLLQEQLIQ
jgi:hypothetical protein